MKKRLVTVATVLVFLGLLTIIHMSKQNSFNVYNITTETNNSDLILENLKMISMNNRVYIDSYTLSKNSEIETDVTDIQIEASINSQVILILSLTNLDDDKMYIEEQKLIKNIKLSTDSIINLKFKYTVDGVKTESYEELNLLDYQLFINEVNKTLKN
ncbi:hypothetical protein [Turicibacter sp. GALT-G1]|uniref:hypothetical protein n=1 Tax=Turicibacter sp. GALT-G1 TaxID=2951140 RepID=UPI0021D5015E|nr:hypothetical protein [Turicibacter sp. GALT-G1]MCU7205737.1 hypothetical protein [Turicibacter sp. GALT-G1]